MKWCCLSSVGRWGLVGLDFGNVVAFAVMVAVRGSVDVMTIVL
jgi:hypothetical protein